MSDNASTQTGIDAVLERAHKAMRYIDDLCQGKRTWTMTIPVDLEHDDDVVLGAVVGDARQLAAEVEQLREFVRRFVAAGGYEDGDLLDALMVLWDDAVALLDDREESL